MSEWKRRAAVTPERVVVEAPARLHLGFLDLNGNIGRRYGSLGLTIDGFAARVRVERGQSFSASGPDCERALGYARSVMSSLASPGAVKIEVESAVPRHIGLGSGTQLGLAVGTAIARLHSLDMTTRDMAVPLERGARSGIGIGAFDDGGFLIDGGLGKDDNPPPLIARHAFPQEWRLILVFDARRQGLHGEQETLAFRDLPAFPDSQAAHLCHLTMMRILPALMERNLNEFARGIGELQAVIGDHFAPAQGGRFSSPLVGEALSWFQQHGIPGVGQSSWGPTGFALLGSQAEADALLAQAAVRFGKLPQLRFQVVSARNRGSVIELDTDPLQDLALKA